ATRVVRVLRHPARDPLLQARRAEEGLAAPVGDDGAQPAQPGAVPGGAGGGVPHRLADAVAVPVVGEGDRGGAAGALEAVRRVVGVAERLAPGALGEAVAVVVVGERGRALGREPVGVVVGRGGRRATLGLAGAAADVVVAPAR